ncbi:hypothetical protein HS3_02516 [Bacillus subtilis]|nr:hypothetical protein HS3_02516 [Bacillus subtilis]
MRNAMEKAAILGKLKKILVMVSRLKQIKNENTIWSLSIAMTYLFFYV